MKAVISRIIGILLALVIFSGVFSVLSELLPYRDFRLQMVWDDIYGERDIDCLFVGSSHVYTGINPDVVAQMTGLDTVLLSAGVQTMAETYYSLEEVLKYETPQYVFIDLYGMYKEFIQGDNFMNIDCMKLSALKLSLAKAVFPDTPKVDIAFPLVREHSNWKEFENVKNNYYMLKYPPENTDGYSGIDTVMKAETAEYFENLRYDDKKITLREEDVKYLRKIKELADSKGIDLRFIMIPWFKGYTDKINYQSLMSSIGEVIEFTDYTGQSDTIGLDYTHYIDEKPSDNQHLNTVGAEIFTKYLVKSENLA